MSGTSNAVNLLQEIPKLHRTKDRLSYDLNGLALSYVRTKVDELDHRLQAIEELLSAVYLRLDAATSQPPTPVTTVIDETTSPSARRQRRPLVDSFDGTFVPSEHALLAATADAAPDQVEDLPWWRRLYIELFHPERLRRR